MRQPTPAIALAGAPAAIPPLDPALIERLRARCSEVRTDDTSRRESSHDWWPLAMHWALAGRVLGPAAAVCRPADAAEVAAVVRLCHELGVPVTAAGGRSGVCGASVPVHGGVVLDTTAMAGITAVDPVSGLVEVRPGTFGDDLEAELRAEHGLTVGHWPQSVAISTVGGWIACRGAGQLSTRYGKIEDMVVSLDVVLADGTPVTTGRGPRAAAGPDLTQLFVGSEGTLGILTSATLRAHPVPPAERRTAFGFPTFLDGLDACRRILRRGATPAVLRLYDEAESQRSHATDGSVAVLLVLDEGEPTIIDGAMHVVGEECRAATRLDDDLVERWFHHRNDVSALEALTRRGFVVDTMEIAAAWSALPRIYAATVEAMRAVPHTRAATAHLSHSYPDGACLYFTFAATPPAEEIDRTYLALWDAGTRTVLEHGGNLSHHHGVGLNRSRFMADALGTEAMTVLHAVKRALDPKGILNPGKLGLASPFGEAAWP